MWLNVRQNPTFLGLNACSTTWLLCVLRKNVYSFWALKPLSFVKLGKINVQCRNVTRLKWNNLLGCLELCFYIAHLHKSKVCKLKLHNILHVPHSFTWGLKRTPSVFLCFFFLNSCTELIFSSDHMRVCLVQHHSASEGCALSSWTSCAVSFVLNVEIKCGVMFRWK